MNVLIPFTVKSQSERTIRTAIELLGSNETIRILAVHITDTDDTAAEIAASEIESMGERQVASVEAEVRGVASDDMSKSAVRDAIEEIVETNGIDLVILGYEKKSFFEQLFESDTTERMLETYDIPVLLVP